jgi:hypothetical protein
MNWGDGNAPWVMPKDYQHAYLGTLANLKAPTRYALRFKKHVVKGKLQTMKSHDYHVLFQQILSISMRHIISKEH